MHFLSQRSGLAVALLLLTVTGCSAKDLSRAKAADLIKGKYFRAEATEADGRFYQVYTGLHSAVGKDELQLLQQLQDKGLITYQKGLLWDFLQL